MTTSHTFPTRAARAAFIATLPAGTTYTFKKRSGVYMQPGRGMTSVLEYIAVVTK